ncbi:10023_t:CDS:1, partial [Dentiscutata heterogama]
SMRVFYIFEKIGVEQIYRTSTMDLRMIRKLDSRDYQNLVKAVDDVSQHQLK